MAQTMNMSTRICPPKENSVSLPREVLKWVQSLDLSYSIKSTKRDFANGFLVAEIFSRYYPNNIAMHTYENGTKMACRNDNWEQLFRFFQKVNLPISRSDFEAVVDCDPAATASLLLKIYTLLTKRTVPVFIVQELPQVERSAKRELPEGGEAPPEEVEQPVSPTTMAPASPGPDAYQVLRAARHNRSVGRATTATAVQERAEAVTLEIKEQAVRSVNKNVAQLRTQQAQQQHISAAKSSHAASVSGRKSAAGSEAGHSTPSLGNMGHAKSAMDVMRPVVTGVLQEDSQVMKSLDPRKDVVVSFMELCRNLIPPEMSVKVFDSLSNQAQALVDTTSKSPAEFWRVWALYSPALADFSENSPVFESVVFLFKRLGVLMQEADGVLTQQLMLDVGLPTLGTLLADCPGKREAICDLVYTYAQPAVLSHLSALRALKDSIEQLPAYVACLSYFVSLELRMGLLDEHLLEHYMYYAHVALQSPQPRIRIAGLSILVTITANSEEHTLNVLSLLTSWAPLVHDEWWEIQAQLLLLTSQLLTHIGQGIEEREAGDDVPPEESTSVNSLLSIVQRLMSPGTSKNVLQVGLCALAENLRLYPALLPSYVAALVRQPVALRRRLLCQDRDPEEDRPAKRSLAYVMGTSSRLYEEHCIRDCWSNIDIARTIGEQAEASQLAHFDPEHLEVFKACLPDDDVDLDEAWIEVFEKVKPFIFVALVDPALHKGASEVVRRFWLCRPQTQALRAIEASKRMLLQTLRILYTDLDKTRVHEDDMLDFLREMRDHGGAIQDALQAAVDGFREAHNAAFLRSNLDQLFE